MLITNLQVDKIILKTFYGHHALLFLPNTDPWASSFVLNWTCQPTLKPYVIKGILGVSSNLLQQNLSKEYLSLNLNLPFGWDRPLPVGKECVPSVTQGLVFKNTQIQDLVDKGHLRGLDPTSWDIGDSPALYWEGAYSSKTLNAAGSEFEDSWDAVIDPTKLTREELIDLNVIKINQIIVNKLVNWDVCAELFTQDELTLAGIIMLNPIITDVSTTAETRLSLIKSVMLEFW